MLSLLLFLTPVLVSGVTFRLTHERVQNVFYLTCGIQNGPPPEDVQFWINETSRTAIPKLYAQQVRNVLFRLVPQLEGTFYCGEPDGTRSNGLGPFAGKYSV